MTSPSSIKATAVVMGGTGEIGLQVSKILLSEYRTSFPTVRITTRDTTSPKACELAKLGAEVHSFNDESPDDIFSGADVVVNALPASVALEQRTAHAQALVHNNVKVYFLSEYGVDYRLNEFPGYNHVLFEQKTKIKAETHAVAQGKTKIIALMTGIFLEFILHSPLGFDIDNNVYTPLGPGTVRVAVNAESDVGRSVAQLAVLALDPATASKVPDEVRIAGQNVSYEEVRDVVARHKGIAKGKIHTKDLAEYRNRIRANPSAATLHDYLLIVIGEGKADFSSVNHNELVNPGQTLWRWKTVEDKLAGRE